MARRIAARSDHKLFHHVAIITSGKRVLAFGYNRGELHAEEIAIRRLNAYTRNNGGPPHSLTLTSIMFKRKNGVLGTSSFPCNKCLLKMEKANIRWVTYIDRGMVKTV